MIINALTESEDFKRCIREQRWITAEPHDSRRCANPVCRSPGSFAMPRDINYCWSLWQQTISNNPMGRSPVRFAKRRESALMPLSPGNVFATNPLPSPWVPLGLPGGLPPRLAVDTHIRDFNWQYKFFNNKIIQPNVLKILRSFKINLD